MPASDVKVPLHVFNAELDCVRARRAAMASDPGEERKLDASARVDGAFEPSTRHNLVGLAFSGGGIRSATVNLGLAQALHEHGVFDQVDYMSTVSGGGYLGSSLSALMRKPGARFPFAHTDGPDESPHLTWLRNHSNYMVEGGFLDYLRIVAVLIRGVAINFLVLLPVLLLAALALHRVYGPLLRAWDGGGTVPRWIAWLDGLPLTHAPFFLTPWVAALVVLHFFMFPAVARSFKVVTHRRSTSSVRQRERYELSFGLALFIVAGVAGVEALPLLVHYFHNLNDVAAAFATGITGGVSVVVLSSAGKLLTYFRRLGRVLLMLAALLLGVLVPLVVLLYVTEALTFTDSGIGLPWWSLLAIPVLLAAGTLFVIVRRISMQGVKGSAWLFGILLLLCVVCFALFALQAYLISVEAFIVVLTVEIALFTWLAVDVNLTSVHGLYRDRLASAYLVGEDTAGVVDIEHDVNLQDLCQPGSRAPYHLINVALNLQGSHEPEIRERNSDFFIFSKKFFGGPRTGYCPIEDLEAVFPQIDLGTAMAISAAAASPNMGTATTAPLVAIMTLLNIRLGVWMPHPGRLAAWADAERRAGRPVSSSLWARYQWRIRPTAFLREIASRLHTAWRWVNLSDGGHIENLAVIELLRRRCRFVIAGDGEADPRIEFGGLATLMRYARIDLGIQIEILLDDLRLDERHFGHQHCAFGRIHYPPSTPGAQAETGYLLYVKSSVSGDEDEIMTEYRHRNPTFPHETTADQMFDEGQFEAYRSLGYHIGSGLFDPAQDGAAPIASFADFEAWFLRLESNLAPSLAAESLFLELKSELNAIQELLQREELTDYFYELHPELASDPPRRNDTPSPERSRKILHVVGKQLRLMESVFVALDLERPRNRVHEGNRGWMRRFDRWARSESFRTGCALTLDLYSRKFQEFCKESWGLEAT